jgi:hypothetical protein
METDLAAAKVIHEEKANSNNNEPLPLPPFRIVPTEIRRHIDETVLQPIQAGKFATKLVQSSILRSLDIMEQKRVFYQPLVSHLSSLSPNANTTQVVYARTAEAKAGARNGGQIWNAAERRRCVWTRRSISMRYSEHEYLAAVRGQLGLGVSELMGHQVKPDDCCTCRFKTALNEFDQHLNGCPHGQAARSRAHKRVQDTVVQSLSTLHLAH